MNKLEAFRYVMFKLIEWYRAEPRQDIQAFNTNNDFSVLKSLKLLYFTVAVNAKNNSLLHVFDKFVAMQYGHVESDVYDHLKRNGHFPGIDIGDKSYITTEFETSISLLRNNNIKVCSEIDEAIAILKKRNGNDFVNFRAFDYVDMSHSLNSWKLYFAKAQYMKVGSIPIDDHIIRTDGQYFILESKAGY